MTSAPDLIVSFNAGREAERLALKYKAMRTNAFSFLRGTAHLFYDRLTSKAPLPPGPTAWICGDLHMENFGSFQGGNGSIVFDVNDFDEAACAPAAWDICRLATSILVAGPTIGQIPKATTDAAKAAIESYFVALTTGKPLWLDDATADGPIGTLLHTVAKRDPSKLLDKRTVVKKGKRSLIVDGTKTLAIDDDDRVALRSFVEQLPPRKRGRHYTFLDAGRRVAGTGSLGLPRYVLLVAFDGDHDDTGLLDLKAAAPTALAPYTTSPPGHVWATEAERVVALQSRFQATTPADLSAQMFKGASYLLKQLQPSADRLDLEILSQTPGSLSTVVATMGQLTAWGHLRGAGHAKAASVEDLLALPNQVSISEIFECAATLARINGADWKNYCAAMDAGAILPQSR